MEEAFSRLVRRQQGLFTRADAFRLGFSGHDVRQRLNRGEWQPVIGPTMATAGTEITRELIDQAAALAMPNAALAGPSAARAWGMPVSDERTMLAVPAGDRRRLPGVAILRADLDPADLGWLSRTRVTWRQRTVFDCLRLVPRSQGVGLLDRAPQQGWASLDGLRELRHRNVGRRGVGQVTKLLREAAGGERSDLERRLTRLLREAGITGWQANVPITDDAGLIGVGDVVFRSRRLVLEVDGRTFHSTPERFQRDRTRQNRLIAAGWTILRFTWHDLTDRPDQVVKLVRRVRDGD